MGNWSEITNNLLIRNGVFEIETQKHVGTWKRMCFLLWDVCGVDDGATFPHDVVCGFIAKIFKLPSSLFH